MLHGDFPEKDLMRTFESKQNIAAILGRPDNNVIIAQSPISLIKIIAGESGTIASDQIDTLAAVFEFRANCSPEASAEIAVTLWYESASHQVAEALAKSSFPLLRPPVRNRRLPANRQVFLQLGAPPMHGRSRSPALRRCRERDGFLLLPNAEISE